MEEDYESLPENTSMSTHMMAGAAAGIMEHCIMYPVDCVKTRMMCLVPDPKANYRSIGDAMYKIVRYEGLRNTMRGINAVVYGAGPAHALYFACYEKMKKILSRKDASNHIAYGVAGGMATVLHDAIMTPADVVKQRMQVYNSPYKSCLDCVAKLYKQEGIKPFYRSFSTQLSMNIPFQSIHFVVYEWCQDILNKEHQYSPSTHMISGAIAGAVAAGATTPLDVIKTLLNTQEIGISNVQTTSRISGIVQGCKAVYRIRGFPGFFQGMSARILFTMPSTAISWSVYEFFKYAIHKRQQGANCDGYIRPPTRLAVQAHADSDSANSLPTVHTGVRSC